MAAGFELAPVQGGRLSRTSLELAALGLSVAFLIAGGVVALVEITGDGRLIAVFFLAMPFAYGSVFPQ